MDDRGTKPTGPGSAWEEANRRKLGARFWVETLLMVISLSAFYGMAFGFVELERGEFWPLLVPTGFLAYMCQKMFREEEFPWHRKSSVIFGTLLLIALVLIIIRDSQLPLTHQ